MGRLSGFRYRQIVKKLKAFGFEFFRHAAGSHEIWFNPLTKKFTTIPNHSGDMPEGTLRAILKQANINTDDFLNKKMPGLHNQAMMEFGAMLCKPKNPGINKVFSSVGEERVCQVLDNLN